MVAFQNFAKFETEKVRSNLNRLKNKGKFESNYVEIILTGISV